MEAKPIEKCNLKHIPERLHAAGRSDIQNFEIGEELYRRCKPEHLINPFASISLRDISINRQGLKLQKLSNPEDVLLNLNLERNPDEILKESVCILVVKELEGNTYRKEAVDLKTKITLLHDQLACNYAHCVFQIEFDGKVVLEDNYDQTINNKKDKTASKGRTWCRQELAEMIIKREVKINW